MSLTASTIRAGRACPIHVLIVAFAFILGACQSAPSPRAIHGARLDRVLNAAFPSVVSVLKDKFPFEYTLIYANLLAETERGYSDADLRQSLTGEYVMFMLRKRGAVQFAPADSLTVVARAELRTVHFLRTVGEGECAVFGMKTERIFNSDVPRRFQPFFDELRAAKLVAVYAGLTTPVAFTEPTDADWRALDAAMKQRGASLDRFGQYFGFSGPAEPPVKEVCAETVALFEAMLAIPVKHRVPIQHRNSGL